jgi:putative restriction endonuclease
MAAAPKSVITRDDLLKRFRELNVWKRGGERAPHKPLLVLLALAQLQRKGDRLMRYESIEEPLERLLREFGPRRKGYHPEYPFWHLKNDRVWEVPDESSYAMKTGGSSPTRTELIAKQALAGFSEPAYQLLRADAGLRTEIARELLEGNFPESLHDEILDAVGLELGSRTQRDSRDPNFRAAVLEAYSRACAVCGFDGHLTSGPFGLDAAHVKWRVAGGPDEVSNGIAMCVLHHRAFDRGAFTIRTDLRLSVSADLTGGDSIRALFLDLHGVPMRAPHAQKHHPQPEFLGWHFDEVFRSPARGS